MYMHRWSSKCLVLMTSKIWHYDRKLCVALVDESMSLLFRMIWSDKMHALMDFHWSEAYENEAMVLTSKSKSGIFYFYILSQ